MMEPLTFYPIRESCRSMLDLLKKHFGYETFRPLQEDIISHCVAGKDALVLMPTGGGKSLCYQLPALKFEGLTLVISPLIALMKDQVDALRANGIAAAFINSSLPPSEVVRVEEQATKGKLKLLYIAPERLAMRPVQQFLQTLKINLVAIDEAHCISEWGHDFRPDYRNLRMLRHLFPGTPIMALTATANARVRDDIVAQLGLQNGRIFQSSFNRPNLTYRVLPKKKAFDGLLREIRERQGESAIVYCFSRKGAEKVAADLRANKIEAAAYHAGLTPLQRTRVQEKFIRDQVPVIAATIAFGMGIDKPDVRLVVHMDLPKSVEGYYQETGRAGRDGLPSDCLLFYSNGDRFKHEYFIRMMDDEVEQQRARRQLNEIATYGELNTCRRAYLLKYFGEASSQTNCGSCDVCVPRQKAHATSDATDETFDQELFEKLRATRRTLADARGVPPYVIFGDKSLQEMARYFPQRLESLANIFGVGKEKLSQYGGKFLQDICSYAESKQIAEREIPSSESTRRTAPRTKRALADTVLTSVKLFEEQKTLDQIAKLRELSVGTIVNHLEQAMDQGMKVDSSHQPAPSEERLKTIATTFKNIGNDMLAPAKIRLGESYSYDELRLARFLLRTR